MSSMGLIKSIEYRWLENYSVDENTKISFGQIYYYNSDWEVLDVNTFKGISKDRFIDMYKSYNEYVTENIYCGFVTWSLR